MDIRDELHFPPGKVCGQALLDLLGRHGARSKRVLQGPAWGEDAAAVLHSQPVLVVSTNPVAFPAPRPAWLAVHLNANNVVTRGAEPTWFQASLLLAPQDGCPSRLEALFTELGAACGEVGAQLLGGHTEVVPNLPRTIVSGTMLGEVTTTRLTATRDLRPGDAVLQVGNVALLGSALLAMHAASKLLSCGLSREEIAQAHAFMQHPGISVVRAARLASQAATPHAMHDVSRGGLAQGLLDLAKAAGLGLEIEAHQVLIAASTEKIAAALDMDPWEMLGSGCLLIACSEQDAAGLLDDCRQGGLAAARIGRAVSTPGAWRVMPDGTRLPLQPCAEDPVLRYLEHDASTNPR